METWQLVYVIIVHFLFDWILQPRWMAKEKVKNTTIALTHGLIVSVPLFVIFWAPFVLLYAVIHGLQDRYLYGILNKLWDTGDKETNLVNHVAIDQTLHLLILIFMLTL